MSQTFQRIRELVASRHVEISRHGYLKFAKEAITLDEVLNGVANGIVVEDYPNYYKGPCVLVLQKDARNRPGSCCVGVAWECIVAGCLGYCISPGSTSLER